ncbi:ComEC/Rec2 family protein [Chlamydia pneumoniae LPCoLN]|uniref:ComEC/Rec2 family competence protein n=1 Tax=Chlamydia pneumoniae TaxID=83558 RepID=UPI0001BD9E3F|nr:ComEC/Rec2 family competence protein [Chlamydia pneumoniae]ACZ33009.1 ComEC/Rec2 family protein [Chlamydia pneumoniae LPCoLN]ETR79909.1 competence locus E-like protein [Chlamydia pneumoniae B21]
MWNRCQVFSSFFFRYPISSWLIRLRASCECFQQRHPIFLCGLYWLAGITSRGHPECSALILIFLGMFLPRNPKQWLPLASAWIISLMLTPAPFLHDGPISGTFVIHHAGGQGTYYGEALCIQTPCGKRAHHLSCQILSESRLELKKVYELEGTLHHTSQIVFKSNACYKEIPRSRFYIMKEKCRESSCHFLNHRFPSSEVGPFASSLLLGTPLPQNLRDLFRQKGLSHLFAISGWHFSLCATTLWMLCALLPLKIKKILSFIVLTSLACIFPMSPSVWRSWISVTLLCFSWCFSGSCSGLNRLGAGFILCSIFFSPFSPTFVLSFLATLGILLFFPKIFSFLYTPWTQFLSPFWLYPIRYLAMTLAISLSAQLFIVLPIMQYFGSLPLEGLLYNLIVPFTILPIIVFLIATIILPCCSPITEALIQGFLSHPWLHNPNILKTLSFAPVPPWMLTLASLILFFIGILRTNVSPYASISATSYRFIETL